MALVRFWLFLSICLFLICATGCAGNRDKDHLAGRFAGATEPNSPATAELTERYTQVVKALGDLRMHNQQLTEENTRLKAQVEDLQAKLSQTQTELNDANILLMQMLGELNKWKADVLGFRDEMRQAAKAQLEALAKILEALGAQPGGAGQEQGQ
ncbi:MAG: hypothetical protein QHH07_07125 [Sedimentisphaerales bacterium]|nr:hypothetical protein [Sedimentisphaerales bacterium]